jgi:hypothetical protein
VTTTLDSKLRAVIKTKTFRPGDVLQIEEQSTDVVVLKRMRPAAGPKARLVKKNGELFVVGGPKVTEEQIKEALAEFP